MNIKTIDKKNLQKLFEKRVVTWWKQKKNEKKKRRSCVQQLLKGVHIEQAKVTNRLERNADGLVTMVY